MWTVERSQNLRGYAGFDDFVGNRLEAFAVRRVVTLEDRKVKVVSSVDLYVQEARAAKPPSKAALAGNPNALHT